MSEFSPGGGPENKEWRAPIHGPEGFDVSENAAGIPEADRVKVSREDLRPPRDFEKGAALFNLVVNVKDIRDPKIGEVGALYPEEAAEFQRGIRTYMDTVYSGVLEAERQDIDVIVFAGEADLVTPGPEGLRSSHQRAMETGDRAIAGIREAMAAYGVDQQSLTLQHDRPVGVNTLDDLRLMHPLGSEADQRYLDALVAKYGTGRELWMVFEDDTEKELREQLGAEGPTEIANRTGYFLNVCTTVADLHQKEDPDKRVIVFAFGNYDNISPWIKQHLVGIDPATGFVPIEKGGGLVIKRSPDGLATTQIGDKKFDVTLESLA